MGRVEVAYHSHTNSQRNTSTKTSKYSENDELGAVLGHTTSNSESQEHNSGEEQDWPAAYDLGNRCQEKRPEGVW